MKKHLDHITLVVCVDAAGGHTTPSVILSTATATMSDVTSIPGYTLSGSKKGWMNRKLFAAWVDNVFLKHVTAVRQQLNQPNASAVLITDRHNSRECPEALTRLMASNVTVLTLPAHSSHIIQPLDRTVFGALKNYLLAKIDFSDTDSASIQRQKILQALGTAFYHAVEPGTVMNGWKISGLYPFNPAVVLNNTTLVLQQAIRETSERGTTRLNISGKVISTAEMIRELTEREAKKKQDKVRRDARATARNPPQ
jgi:hypothetical protein